MSNERPTKQSGALIETQARLAAAKSPFDTATVFVVARALSAGLLATEYFAWLARVIPFLRVTTGARAERTLSVLFVPLIRLSPPSRFDDGEARFDVEGGLLARAGGHFLFRCESTRVEIALSGYLTRLPRCLHRATQARLHDWLTQRFARFIVDRMSTDQSPL